MKILTVATKDEGYFDLLNQTAKRWGYDLHVLGWQQPWKGFAWKLELYIDALLKLPSEESIICVDGYDVVVIAPAYEMSEKFKRLKKRIIFSGQRYFPNQRWIQNLADHAMHYDVPETMNKSAKNFKEYSRPCMGLSVAYAGDLLVLFQNLLDIERRESLKDDQALLNIYYSQHPDAIYLDYNCLMFQNLWRTRGGKYGKISPLDSSSEVEVIYDETIGSRRVRNKQFQTNACFLHGPMNLDMGLILDDLHLFPPKRTFQKGWDYWQYSIMHHSYRACKLYFSSFIDQVLSRPMN